MLLNLATLPFSNSQRLGEKYMKIITQKQAQKHSRKAEFR